MTITSLQRPTSLQSITQLHAGTINNSSTQSTQSDIEVHIYNMIQQGEVFTAKYQMQLINRTNGYTVISDAQFKIWRIEYLKNEKSNIKNKQKGNYKNQNSQKGKSKNESVNFQKELQKAYMELFSV